MTSRYWRLEAAQIVGRLPLAALAFGVMCLVADQVIIPALPALVIEVMERAFRFEGLGRAILLNDFTGIYMSLYFTGVAQLWGVVLRPRDERYLELLLSKPVRPEVFVMARVLPVLASTLTVGCLLALGCALGASRHGLDPLGAAGGALMLTALSIILLLVLNLVFTVLRDPLVGFLAAGLLWFLTMAPAALLLYRPDLLEPHEAWLPWLALLPTLVWNANMMPLLSLLGLVMALALTWPLAWAAGRLLDRHGIF